MKNVNYNVCESLWAPYYSGAAWRQRCNYHVTGPSMNNNNTREISILWRTPLHTAHTHPSHTGKTKTVATGPTGSSQRSRPWSWHCV